MINTESDAAPLYCLYGYDQQVEQRWAQHLADNPAQLSLARVIADYGREYQLVTANNTIAAQCPASLLTTASRPVVGDWVGLAADTGTIKTLVSRRNQLSRQASGRSTSEQVIAANVDRVLVVMAMDHDFNIARLERWLVLIRQSAAQPTVILSKCDLSAAPDRQLAQVARVVGEVPVILLSALSGEGIDQLCATLCVGESVAMVGSSGVGKSTLANRLLGEALMATRAVRESDSRGRHTTTYRQLLRLPGGALLIDGPGMREVQLWADEQALSNTFADIEAVAAACRFNDCQHGNEPGCAVQKALASGQLDAGRLQRWRQLADELAAHQRRRDVVAQRQYERQQGRLYQQIQSEKRRRKRRG